MCGRYQFNFKNKDEFRKRYDIGSEFPYSEIKTRYNITPGTPMPVVTRHSPNAVEIMLWGMIPEWDKSDKPRGFINLRDDTVANKPWAWKYLRFQRCLVPASGFYEWKKTADEKIPYYFHLPGANYFSFAGLYNEWRDKKTYTIITTSPSPLMKPIHNRMPVILTKEEEKQWLNPDETEVDKLKIFLKPYRGKMDAYPISRRINSPINNNAEIIKPIDS